MSRRSLACALALAALTLLFFWPALDNGFVNWDDPGNIVMNPNLGRFDPAGLAWSFQSTLYGHFQPLAWLSLSLDRLIWGLDPAGFHLTAVLLHSASAVLLFFLLRELSLDELSSLAASALFAWHPLRVESVAWATERRDGLLLLFSLLSCLLYIRAVRKDPRNPSLLPALLAFILASFSKVFAVVLPGVFLCLDLGLLRRPLKARRLLGEKWAFFAIAVAVLALGVRAQSLSGSLSDAGVLERLSVAAWTPGWSAWKTLLPSRLSPLVYVDFRAEPARFWPMAALTAVLLGLWAYAWRRHRPSFWLGAAALLTLLPALGFFKSGPQSSADRYTLLPAAVLAVGAANLLRRLGPRFSMGAFALAALLGLLTRAQCRVWRDSISLWTRAAESGPPNPIALGNLAAALRAVGREDEALSLYAKLASMDPENPATLAVAGDARYEAGDWPAAAELFAKALALNPDLPTVRVNYGLCLYRLGRVPEAAEQFAKAADQNPRLPDAWHNLGIALARLGRLDDAKLCLERALALSPGRRDSRDALKQIAGARKRGAPAARRP